MKTDERSAIEIIDVDAPSKKRESKKRKKLDKDDKMNPDKCYPPSSSSLLNNHPHSQLPSFLSEAFSDLFAQDGLVVLGRGLGWLSLLAAFVRYYGDPECHDNGDENDDDDGATKTSTTSSLPPPKYPGDDLDCKLQHAQNMKQQQHKKPPLVFVLNLRDKERQVLFSTLTSWGCPPDQLPTLITNEAGQNEERAVKYARGGVFVITSRILIVDLLNGTANAKAIDGMLVAHAENVDETSTEAFILRIFRSQKYFMNNTSYSAGNGSQNNNGFIKAFTDNASSLVAGFAKTEKILKALQVPNIYLFPRFHSAVAEELEVNPPIVEELHQSLTPRMKDIQDHLKLAVRAVMRELKTKSPLVDFSVFLGGGSGSKKRKKNDYTNEAKIGNNDDSKDDFVISLEQCITTNFDRVISRQLEGDWHRLSFKVKQLVKDLGKLRQLFHHLIHYDSIDFLNFLQGIKAMNAVSVEPSLWIGEYSGENVFRIAKERVYRVSQKGKLITVLEENMKEALLQQVLTEIENRWEKKLRDSDEANDRSTVATRSNNVLLMVKDERTLKSIREYLVEGGKRSMATKWLRYLERVNEKTRSLLNSMEGGLKSLSGEQRLLYEEEPAVRNTLFPRDCNTAHAQQQEADFAVRNKNLAASKRKRRKITEEKSRGRANADLYEDQALFEEKIEASRLPDMQPQTYNEESDDSSALSYSSEDEDELLFKVEALDGLSLFIRAFSQIEEGEAALLLQDLQPDTVILYDSDASFIRTLEIYANTMASTSEDEKRRLQVFFLLYESCAEEISFTKTLERETEAFNRLIDYKKRMPSLVSAFNTFSTQEMQQSHGGVGGSYAGGTLPLSMDTRTGRGKQNVSKERRDIAVDVREFRAKLPSVLHQGGMRLAPATLVVGDYILSDVHCVERKSISDFYQSMDNSSRLKEQAEKMVKYYKIPILLLEFDPEKTFQLQNPNELGGEIKKNSITSKLCILVTAFPMLRILWSRSPHETLKVFKKLKCNHQEVNVDKAIEIGTNDAMDELLGGGPGGCYNEDDDDEGDGANEAAVQMLLRLPGVTSHNARNIIKECDSIAELAEMSREKLKLLAGQKAGQKLFTFFRQPFSG